MNASKNNDIKQKLEKDIETLIDPQRGYIRAGLPNYRAFFGRDACIASGQLLKYDPTIACRTIELLTQLQGKVINTALEEEPGKILHEWHQDPTKYKPLPWPVPYYGSVDSTPLFIYLCGLYNEKSMDIEWRKKYWPHIVSALDWCEQYGDLDGDALLAYERKNPKGLFHQGWKDDFEDHLGLKPPVKIIEAQGYYYAALRKAAMLARILGKYDFQKKLLERAEKVKKATIEKFWLPDENFFAIGLAELKYPSKRITSNPGHLLFTGILDGEVPKIKAVVNRLFQDDMWTPYGVRTLSKLESVFDPMGRRDSHHGTIWPHDNWIIAQGLKRYGFNLEYKMIKNALLLAFNAFGKIPEFYAVVDGEIKEIPNTCSIQAWASGALLNFLLEDDQK